MAFSDADWQYVSNGKYRPPEVGERHLLCCVTGTTAAES
jgi:hypothetical protein